jgi:hypothetical protein
MAGIVCIVSLVLMFVFFIIAVNCWDWEEFFLFMGVLSLLVFIISFVFWLSSDNNEIVQTTKYKPYQVHFLNNDTNYNNVVIDGVLYKVSFDWVRNVTIISNCEKNGGVTYKTNIKLICDYANTGVKIDIEPKESSYKDVQKNNTEVEWWNNIE